MDHLFPMASATGHIRLQTVYLPLSLFLPSTCYASVIQGISLNLLRPPECLSRGKTPLLALTYLRRAVCFVSVDSRKSSTTTAKVKLVIREAPPTLLGLHHERKEACSRIWDISL